MLRMEGVVTEVEMVNGSRVTGGGGGEKKRGEGGIGRNGSRGEGRWRRGWDGDGPDGSGGGFGAGEVWGGGVRREKLDRGGSEDGSAVGAEEGSNGKEVVREAIIRDKVEEGGNRGEGDGTTGGGCEGSAIGLGDGNRRERMELAEVSDGREGGLAEEDDGYTRVSGDGWESRWEWMDPHSGWWTSRMWETSGVAPEPASLMVGFTASLMVGWC